MVSIPFKEYFAPAVEAGTKRQTIRQAKCIHFAPDIWPNPCRKGFTESVMDKPPKCYILCPYYKNRIKPGDTLQLYTGLRQRKYCKHPEKIHNVESNKKCHPIMIHDFCSISRKKPYECNWQGAKLLKTATCTESFPIKFEDLKENREMALKDGFKDNRDEGYCKGLKGCPPNNHPAFCDNCSAEWKLCLFLVKNYDAKDGYVFQVVRW